MSEENILSVTQLTTSIKNCLENRFKTVHVQGEVTNITYQSSGHIYFSLKDQSAQLSCVLFRGNAQRLSFKPKAGDKVVVYGEISVYPPRGSYQLICRTLKQAGVGSLLLQLHELKKKLQEKGYFEKSHKTPLPPYPKTIGVITSPTGAVIQDIINVLKRRHAGFHVVLYPVKVQGDGAAQEIAKAIWEANKHNIADVLIVGRGGGSLEDLWPFNEEIVADALFASTLPVIAAVGHETDFSITDFVADIRAPTPSAAAEMVMREQAQQIEFLANAQNQLDTHLKNLIKYHKERLSRYAKHPLFASPYGLLNIQMQKMDDVTTRLQVAIKHHFEKGILRLKNISESLSRNSPQKRISQLEKRLEELHTYICHSTKKKVEDKKRNFSALLAHLQSIDPKNLLQKGYCISFDEKSGSVIMSASSLKEGETAKILYHDGEALVEARKIIQKTAHK